MYSTAPADWATVCLNFTSEFKMLNLGICFILFSDFIFSVFFPEFVFVFQVLFLFVFINFFDCFCKLYGQYPLSLRSCLENQLYAWLSSQLFGYLNLFTGLKNAVISYGKNVS